MAPPMQQRVDLAEQVLDHLDLVGHLGAAEDRRRTDARGCAAPCPGSSTSRAIRKPAPPAGDVLDDALGRGVGAVRRAERVVDVDVGERGELLGERRRRSSLPRRGSGGSRAARRRRGAPPTATRPRRRRSPSAKATGAPSSSASRAATGFRLNSGFGLPFGRPRCDASRSRLAPCAMRVLDRRQRRPDARVVGDRAALERHVEVDADEDPLALEVDVLDRSAWPRLQTLAWPCR